METIVTDSYLTFRLQKEVFSVSVAKVVEIIEVPKITQVPQAPEYMCGVINLRGNVIPLVDTRIKFGLNTTGYTADTSIIIMEVEVADEKVLVGSLVDQVLDVFELLPENIRPTPSIGSKYKPEFIMGMAKMKDDEFVIILNIDKVFSVDEVSILSDSYSLN